MARTWQFRSRVFRRFAQGFVSQPGGGATSWLEFHVLARAVPCEPADWPYTGATY